MRAVAVPSPSAATRRRRGWRSRRRSRSRALPPAGTARRRPVEAGPGLGAPRLARGASRSSTLALLVFHLTGSGPGCRARCWPRSRQCDSSRPDREHCCERDPDDVGADHHADAGQSVRQRSGDRGEEQQVHRPRVVFVAFGLHGAVDLALASLTALPAALSAPVRPAVQLGGDGRLVVVTTNAPRIIGMLGGMGGESSGQHYRLANELVREPLRGLYFARIATAPAEFADVEALQVAGRWKRGRPAARRGRLGTRSRRRRPAADLHQHDAQGRLSGPSRDRDPATELGRHRRTGSDPGITGVAIVPAIASPPPLSTRHRRAGASRGCRGRRLQLAAAPPPTGSTP